jgi:hypothetical protein
MCAAVQFMDVTAKFNSSKTRYIPAERICGTEQLYGKMFIFFSLNSDWKILICSLFVHCPIHFYEHLQRNSIHLVLPVPLCTINHIDTDYYV